MDDVSGVISGGFFGYVPRCLKRDSASVVFAVLTGQLVDEEEDAESNALSAVDEGLNMVGDDVRTTGAQQANVETGVDDDAETGTQQLNGLLNESIILLRSVRSATHLFCRSYLLS